MRSHCKAARKKSQAAVFSNERLSGGHHTGGHDAIELADRIKLCAPDARILMVVREQRSLLLSLYAQYVKGFGCVSLEEYLHPTYTTHNKELFNPVTLEFDKLATEYMKRFDEVLILPFELLKSDPAKMIESILEFMGMEISESEKLSLVGNPHQNVSRPPALQRLDRFLLPLRSSNVPHVGATYHNAVGRTFARALSAGIGSLPMKGLNNRLKAKNEKIINEFATNRFSQSNERLSKLVGMNLKSFGYT